MSKRHDELERVRHIAQRYASVDPQAYGVNQVVVELSRAILSALPPMMADCGPEVVEIKPITIMFQQTSLGRAQEATKLTVPPPGGFGEA